MRDDPNYTGGMLIWSAIVITCVRFVRLFFIISDIPARPNALCTEQSPLCNLATRYSSRRLWAERRAWNLDRASNSYPLPSCGRTSANRGFALTPLCYTHFVYWWDISKCLLPTDDVEDTLQLRGGGSSTTSSTKRRWHDGEKLSRNGGSRCDSPGCLSNSSTQEKKGKYSPSSITSSVTGEMDERSVPASPISTASDRTEIVENNNNRSTTGHPTASDANCNCIVHQVFFGDLESVISYQGCDHRSSTVDPFLDLSLDVAQRGSTSLAACLSSYFRPEVIDGTLPCSQCNVNRPAVKQFYLLNLPNILIFYLKVRCRCLVKFLSLFVSFFALKKDMSFVDFSDVIRIRRSIPRSASL